LGEGYFRPQKQIEINRGYISRGAEQLHSPDGEKGGGLTVKFIGAAGDAKRYAFGKKSNGMMEGGD